MGGFSVMRRLGTAADLVALPDALDALGESGLMGEYRGDVPLASICGTASRSGDFDAMFRPRNRSLGPRMQRVEQAYRSGTPLPPVDLVRLGDLYFVRDGHHRVAVATSLGWTAIPATVQHICTVAFAMACLRAAHLTSKAAERRFLERVPLPDEVRTDLWLDEPSAWLRLADAAEAWGFRQSLDGRRLVDRRQLAEAWWAEEVEPVSAALRRSSSTPGMRDVALYASALHTRDPFGRDALTA